MPTPDWAFCQIPSWAGRQAWWGNSPQIGMCQRIKTKMDEKSAEQRWVIFQKWTFYLRKIRVQRAGGKTVLSCSFHLSFHVRSFRAGIPRGRNGGGQPGWLATIRWQDQHLGILPQVDTPSAFLRPPESRACFHRVEAGMGWVQSFSGKNKKKAI